MVIKNMIRLSKSSVGKKEIKNLTRVIGTSFLGMGLEVKKFEGEIKKYLETKKSVICLNSGTAALHLAIESILSKKKFEVLVPSITYVSSFQAITAAGGKPVICDVTQDKVFIDLEDAKKRISKNTLAIMPVHYASDVSELEKVYKFAKKYKLRVIEDAAHSFGSMFNKEKVGNEGDIICFSFDGIKNITAGEGGAVVTADKKIIKYLKDARLLGVENDTEQRYQGNRSWNFDVKHQGWRYHMSNLNASIGLAQLKKIDLFKTKRQHIVKYYISNLSNIDDIIFLKFNFNKLMPHIFSIKVIKNRDKLKNFLNDNGIRTGFHYAPGHKLTLYKTKYKLKNSERLSKQLISLPLHPELKLSEIKKVINKIKMFYKCN